MPTLPFQPVDHVASLVPTFQAPGSPPMENVFHVLTTGTWDTPNLTLLCNTFENWWKNVVNTSSPRGLTNGTWQYMGVTATDLTTDSGGQVTVPATGGAIVGSAPTNPMWDGLTIAVKLLTGARGKSFRGRFYWCGVDAGNFSVDKQQISGGYGASLIFEANQLMVQIHAANDHWSLGVVSRFNKSLRTVDNPTGRRDSGLFTAMTGAALTDLFIDVQRKRAGAHRGGR